MLLSTPERVVASGGSEPDRPKASKTFFLVIQRLLEVSKAIETCLHPCFPGAFKQYFRGSGIPCSASKTLSSSAQRLLIAAPNASKQPGELLGILGKAPAIYESTHPFGNGRGWCPRSVVHRMPVASATPRPERQHYLDQAHRHQPPCTGPT